MTNKYQLHFQPKRSDSIKYGGDCMIRSMCGVTGAEYNDVYQSARIAGWRVGRSKAPWDVIVIEALRDLGFKVRSRSFTATKGKKRMSVKMFCETFPTGTYILRCAKHVVAVVGGKFLDTWDCSEKCVYLAFEVAPESQDWDPDFLKYVTYPDYK